MKLEELFEAGIMDTFRARREEKKADKAFDKAVDAWSNKAGQYDFADPRREPHEKEFLKQQQIRRQHEEKAKHLRNKKGLMDKARRGFNKAMTWSDEGMTPGGPQGAMDRVRSYDTKTLVDMIKDMDKSGDGSSAQAQQKMIRRELRQRIKDMDDDTLLHLSDKLGGFNTDDKLAMLVWREAGDEGRGLNI